jgi:hypothetical protein
VSRTITQLREEGLIALQTPHEIVLPRPAALAARAEGTA